MADCKFTKRGVQVVCTVCGRAFPPIPNWEKAKRNCTGAVGPNGFKGEWDLRAKANVLEVPTVPPQQRPGWQLLEYYRQQGVPSCQACYALAAKMDGWGTEGSREHLSEIVEDMLPRAKKWVEENRAWIHRLLPGVVEDFGIRLQLRADVTAAIDRAEKAAATPATPEPPPDKLPYSGPITRNLLMFIYPIRGHEWQRNIEQIGRRMDLFNGRRVFAIATDPTTAKASEVIREIEHFQPEILEYQNRIGEVVAFQTLLERIKDGDENDLTFYCHAKGVTHQRKPNLPQVQRWTDAMYEVLLDGYADVETALESHTFAGAFRALGRQFGKVRPVFYNWHYPGTFYWFRTSQLLKCANWNQVQQQYYGTEIWPGTLVTAKRAACLLADNVNFGSLYHADQWLTKWQPALEKWREKQAQKLEAR